MIRVSAGLTGVTVVALLSLFGGQALAQATAADFAAQANEICASAEQRIDDKVRKINDGKAAVDPEAEPKLSGKAFKKTLPISRRAFEQIAELPPPPEEATAIATWLSLSQRAVRQFDKGASALLREDLKTWNRHARKAERFAYRGASAVAHLQMPDCGG